MSEPRRLAAVSTKAYFGAQQTREWVAAAAGLADRARRAGVELAILPSYPMLESTAAALAGTGLTYGAQATVPDNAGAQTGDVVPRLLAELGCRYVEVGHAERRAERGETPDMVRALCRAVAAESMVPLVCVGEPEEGSPQDAARFCVDQLRDATREIPEAEIVVAYEPVWAIGADEPAAPGHIRVVGEALQQEVRGRRGSGRVIYGGTAGPGLVTTLDGYVDGLFLGRRAHDVAALAAVIDELGAVGDR